MSDESAGISPSDAAAPRVGVTLPVPTAVRTAIGTLREALANDGIRRLGFTWMLGVAADGAVVVVALVTVFNLGGVVGAAVFGAVRMIPAVLSGMLAGTLVERFRGDRLLVALGLLRAASAAMIAVTIATAGHTLPDHDVTMAALFVFGAISAAANAPVRPTQVTLMPAFARTPGELVAANTVWSTGEGVGAFVGPFAAGILMGLGAHPAVAAVAAAGFLVIAAVAAGLHFEQVADASGGSQLPHAGLRLRDGIRAIRRKPLLSWTMLGTYGQVLTRGLLNALVVVAAIELLRMGQGGPGLLAAALGLGGLLGAIFAMSSVRTSRLVGTELTALVFWGLPIAVIGIATKPEVALAAMIVIGVANATYDVALFTIFQRASANEERGPALSVLEAVIGLGAITGSLLAPFLIGSLGTRTALIVTGSILPVLVVVIHLRVRRVGRIPVVSEDIVRLLRQVPEFADLPLTAVERVAAGSSAFRVPGGTALTKQGESGDRFIVIESGEIDVFVDGRLIQRLGPGAGVGEIALVRKSPRTATVVAVTDVTGYNVDAATFLAAVAGPAAAAVTERMVEANLRRAGHIAG